MMNMTLTRVAQACNGTLVGDTSDNRVVQGVVVDSRLIKQDDLFIATKGERVDGHNYIKDAFIKGALAVICEKTPLDSTGPYILVEDSLLALKAIASWYRMQLNITVVGITGSVGKTSTKEFISSVLSRKFKVLKTEGNFNNEIGLPLTICRIKSDDQVAVLEMGISDFGEMHRLSEIAKPDICVITNIGQCHLENLGSRQGILKAKTEIFDFMKEDGSVCVNGDDDMLVTIQQVKGKAPLRFGLNLSNDIYASSMITNGLFGSSCNIHVKNESFPVTIPLPGEHMVINALAATSVGTLLGLSTDEITAGIATVQPLGGRSNIVRLKHHTIIDDCYNANPVSMKAAIDLLTKAATNKVAILGDMGELGVDEEALHREIGEYAASSEIDVLVCVGALSSHMHAGAENILRGKQKKLFYFKTREALIQSLPNLIHNNDTILVKASHFMAFDQVVGALKQL